MWQLGIPAPSFTDWSREGWFQYRAQYRLQELSPNTLPSYRNAMNPWPLLQLLCIFSKQLISNAGNKSPWLCICSGKFNKMRKEIKQDCDTLCLSWVVSCISLFWSYMQSLMAESHPGLDHVALETVKWVTEIVRTDYIIVKSSRQVLLLLLTQGW